MFQIISPKKQIVGNPGLISGLKLKTVGFLTFSFNLLLAVFRFFLFNVRSRDPKKILIFKIGNIGDTVCALPVMLAFRKKYKNSHITLLTSPGPQNRPGAKEILPKNSIFNDVITYYTEDIDTLRKKMIFIKSLKKLKPDLFIQIPDDLAGFSTLLRNMFFAKIIGSKNAIGFTVRTLRLFKNTQVNYFFDKTEVESLLDLYPYEELDTAKPEFGINLETSENTTPSSMLENLRSASFKIVFSPGGKRNTNRWPIERFREIAINLVKKFNAGIIAIGNKDEKDLLEKMVSGLPSEKILVSAGLLSLRETLALLKQADFVVANSTGTLHLASAVAKPVIGIYGVRDIYGRWFPYGKNHKVLFHRHLNCDYRREECVKKSLDSVTVDEVFSACERLISELNASNK